MHDTGQGNIVDVLRPAGYTSERRKYWNSSQTVIVTGVTSRQTKISYNALCTAKVELANRQRIGQEIASMSNGI